MPKRTKKDREEAQKQVENARARLLELLRPGVTVWTQVRRVYPSGMSRLISAHVIVDGEPVNVSGWAGTLIGWRVDYDRLAVSVAGCGMDMGFHLVYTLSDALWPDGFGCVGEGCPSNDHSNFDRDHTPHSETRPHWHKDGGYALKQRWL